MVYILKTNIYHTGVVICKISKFRDDQDISIVQHSDCCDRIT